MKVAIVIRLIYAFFADYEVRQKITKCVFDGTNNLLRNYSRCTGQVGSPLSHLGLRKQQTPFRSAYANGVNYEQRKKFSKLEVNRPIEKSGSIPSFGVGGNEVTTRHCEIIQRDGRAVEECSDKRHKGNLDGKGTRNDD